MTTPGNRIARLLLAFFFLGLLVTPLVIKRISAQRDFDRLGRRCRDGPGSPRLLLAGSFSRSRD